MMRDEPDFSLGIEEEYLLVDPETAELVDAPKDFMERCDAELKDQVSPEYLNCQIEIGTGVCKNVGEARSDLKRLRSTIAPHGVPAYASIRNARSARTRSASSRSTTPTFS